MRGPNMTARANVNNAFLYMPFQLKTIVFILLLLLLVGIKIVLNASRIVA